jgi:hypothetical protein
MTSEAIEQIWQARERHDRYAYDGTREQFERAAMYWAQFDPRKNRLESLVEAAALLVAAIECAMREEGGAQ